MILGGGGYGNSTGRHYFFWDKFNSFKKKNFHI